MKKILFMGIIATILSAPTIAAQICAPLQFYGKSPIQSKLYFTADWESHNVRVDTAITMKKPVLSGVAICSSATQTVSGMLPTISSEAEYKTIVYCWIRAIKPVVSDWWRLEEYDTAAECLQNCSYDANVFMLGFHNSDFVNDIIQDGNQI